MTADTKPSRHAAAPFSTACMAVAALAGCVAMSAAARAEMLCGEREHIVDELKKTWQEDRTAIGLSNNGGVLEVFSSEQGTWTLLLTMPEGQTCMIGAGEHWEQTQVALLGEPI
ncbi:MAG: hypothetical protein R3F55_23320 [Alphaproteobacteria bacterium]